MKRKAKLYGPVLLAALLCALVFATGALKKPKIFENITTDYMAFQKKLPRYSLADGDEYGVIPMGRRGWMHLPAGEYRLRWTISCDGDNILRLTNTNDATITPSEFTIPAGAGDGELHFTVEEDCEDFKIEFEFAAGTYMDIYQVKLYTPEYQDDAFTLLFFAVGASILWLMIGTGRLTRENMAPVLFIALAVLIGSAPALKTTFVIGHDGTYHMARLLNLADGLKNGQFPVRMGGFAYDGYGGVMSVFYPDTFLYPFALMLLGGASAVYVCNVFSVALNIGAALSMYVAAKRLFEKRWAATGASILYTLASYRVVNVFTRIAFGEALAMIFLPLFLVNLYDVVCGDARRWKGLALSAACIFCSHMITTLFCAVLAAGFCLLHIRKIILQKRLLPLVKAVLVCLLLCLYRIGPFVMYSMQGLGADDLFRNITEFSVELGQVLLMNAGTITRETNNPQITEFSVEIGLPRRADDDCRAGFLPVGRGFAADQRTGGLYSVHVAAADSGHADAGAGGRLRPLRIWRKAAGRGGGRGAVDGGDLRDADFQQRNPEPDLCGKGRHHQPLHGQIVPGIHLFGYDGFPRHPQTLGRNRRGRGDGGLRKAEHDDHGAGERADGKPHHLPAV